MSDEFSYPVTDYAKRQWQPIETAPRDGTEVDLWVVHTEPQIDGKTWSPLRQADCSWSENEGGLWVQFQDIPVEDYGWVATHWMPLPSPPEDR